MQFLCWLAMILVRRINTCYLLFISFIVSINIKYFLFIKLAANSLATILYLLAIHKVLKINILFLYNHLYLFVFCFLLNKDAQRKVRDEILRVLGDNLTLSMEQQKELKYMNMVINENLRLYPPVCIT